MYSYVYKVHIRVYFAARRDDIWTNYFFSLTYFSFQKSTAKDVIVKPRTRIEIEYELHRPSIKGTKLLIAIKAVIIITLDTFFSQSRLSLCFYTFLTSHAVMFLPNAWRV